ncbi:MAG: hypothetical protein OMM_01949 [Candidatus Magnetoglobus multicellularis str. Araruama]|uniref:Phosphoenolpyruvate synthase n=1 Tax=Candidatus Magnetoglobus multicellularis str. Araruama TaxID=890399 RepID=A0A1V1PBQ3_9BACT|nr:MAG: hypothetical protein OMM_01949 [Candidatus Magnetoglobus multicellularis str. Araruama]
MLYRIKCCWSSVWSLRSISYCQRIGVPPQSINMAILIQKTIFVRVSGVIFTCDPLTLNSESIIIEASTKQKTVVSGCISPDFYKLSKELFDIQIIKLKTDKRSLSENDLLWLWTTAKRIAEHFNNPQEIEWAIDKNNLLYILQTRPIIVKR